jgi:hypothetical protein
MDLQNITKYILTAMPVVSDDKWCEYPRYVFRNMYFVDTLVSSSLVCDVTYCEETNIQFFGFKISVT